MTDLYLITPPDGEFLAEIPGVLAAGVDVLQYRRPEESDRARLVELNRLRKLTRVHGVRLIVNNRPDLALAAGADGVHLGRSDLPPDAVKENWPGLTVGATQRVDQQLVAAADYYGVGPVFNPNSKNLDVEPCGWRGVEEVLAKTDRLVYAIGGITRERLEDFPEKLDGVAVIGAVWDSGDPAEAVGDLKNGLAGEAPEK